MLRNKCCRKTRLKFYQGQKLIISDDPMPVKGITWITFCANNFFPNQKIDFDKNHNLLIDGEKLLTSHRYKLTQKIYRQLRLDFQPINFSIKQLQNALLEQIIVTQLPNVKINWHLNTQIESIDLQLNEVNLSNHNDIKFQYLINCEGERGETIPKINLALEDIGEADKKFEYGALTDKETYHMAIKVRAKPIKSNDSHALMRKEYARYKNDLTIQKNVTEMVNQYVYIEDQKVKINTLSFLYDPNIYKIKLPISNWIPKFFVAGRIPKMIHTLNNDDKEKVLLHWASHLISYKFGLTSPDIFEIDPGKKNDPSHHRALTFKYFPKFVNNPVIVLPSNIVIALGGDVALSANYWEGISSTLGLNEMIILAECIDKEIHEKSYQEFKNIYFCFVNFISQTVKNLIPPKATAFFQFSNDTISIELSDGEKNKIKIKDCKKTAYFLNRKETSITSILDTSVLYSLSDIKDETGEIDNFLKTIETFNTPQELRIYIKNCIKNLNEKKSTRYLLFSFLDPQEAQVNLMRQLLTNMDHIELREIRAHANYLDGLSNKSIDANQYANRIHEVLDEFLNELDISVIINKLQNLLNDPILTKHNTNDFLHTKTKQLIYHAIQKLNILYKISDAMPNNLLR